MKYLIFVLLSFLIITSYAGFADAYDTIPVYTVPGVCNHIIYDAEKYPWNTAIVIQLAKLESGCSPIALNDNPETGDYSVGLLQINIKGNLKKNRPSEEKLKTIATNLKVAYSIYVAAGNSFKKDWPNTCKKIKGCE